MNTNNATDTARGKEISRESCCDNFLKRRTLLPENCSCWFCQYAWFQSNESDIPAKGICKYPIRQTN